MKQYKGYYIDHVVFNSEAEIDNFIKKQAVEGYKALCTMFANKPSMELSAMMCDKAKFLHECGLGYDEIEALEAA